MAYPHVSKMKHCNTQQQIALLLLTFVTIVDSLWFFLQDIRWPCSETITVSKLLLSENSKFVNSCANSTRRIYDTVHRNFLRSCAFTVLRKLNITATLFCILNYDIHINISMKVFKNTGFKKVKWEARLLESGLPRSNFNGGCFLSSDKLFPQTGTGDFAIAYPWEFGLYRTQQRLTGTL